MNCPECGNKRVIEELATCTTKNIPPVEVRIRFCPDCDWITITDYDLVDADGPFALTNTVAADESDGVFFAIAHELGEL